MRVWHPPCCDMGRRTRMDIVPNLVEQHRDTYARFEVNDIVTDPLSSPYNLIISRQLTQHLTPTDTLRVLDHFSMSGSNFAMLNTYPQIQQLSLEELENKFDVNNLLRYFGQNLEEAPPICMRTSLQHNYKLDYNPFGDYH